MPAIAANVLKLIFIALIYLFLWQVTRAIAGHLGSRSGRRSKPPGATELVVVRSDTQPGLRIEVHDSLTLGRSPDADVLLEDAYASQFHLRLAVSDGRLLVSDLGSTNGTYVNGRRVTTPMPLSKGDAVQVGKTIMEVR